MSVLPLKDWLILALIVAVGAGGVYLRHHWIAEGAQQQQDKDAVAMAKAERQARDIEHQQAAKFAAAAETYEQEKVDAQKRASDVAAGLRDGYLRLRREWRCPAAVAGVPEAPAGGGEPDADADLRAAGAGRLVRIGAQCDAQVRGLQAALKAERGLK